MDHVAAGDYRTPRQSPHASRESGLHIFLSTTERHCGLKLTATVRYHIQSERQHQMLMNKYGLTAPDPYLFTVYKQTVPLTGNLAAHFEQKPADAPMACAAPHPHQKITS